MSLGLALLTLSMLVSLREPELASAHLGHVVLRAERYVKLDFADDSVRVVVSLTLGPDEARRVLAATDDAGDSNGEVTQAEADAYMAQWGDGLRADLPVDVDGAPVDVAWGEAYMEPIGPIAAAPGTVEMVARVPLAAGAHRVAVHDHMRIETFDRTDIAFRARDGARLVASGIGEPRTPPERDLAVLRDTRRPDDGFVYVAEVEVPGGSDDERPSIPLWLAAVIALCAAAAVTGVLVVRRRARRS